MTARSDIVWNLKVSPRLAQIPTASDKLTIQDLHDTARAKEVRPTSGDDPKLISTAGKQFLGPGKEVGLTATLNDVQVLFEPDLTPVEIGSATSADPNGIELNDSAAQFVTSGVVRGAIILNWTDRSLTEVQSVESETQILHRPLSGGIGNDWDISDQYSIFNVARKTITDGNLVSLDSGGSPIPSVQTTAFTQVTVELDTSAARVLTGTGVGTPEEVADAVWGALTSTYVTIGTFGHFVQRKLLTVAKFLSLK